MIRYNPHSESDDIQQVVATNWEMLRRIPTFQDVAKKWIASKKFRFQHVRERKVYKDNVLPRCALDWMLTPEQRYALAQYQVQHRLFFWDPTKNYGPILVKKRPERQNARLRECIENLFEVTPDPEPGGAVSLDQPWPATPQKFRTQFSSIFVEEDLKEINLIQEGERLARIGNYLVSGQPFTPEDRMVLGRYLFQQGNHLRRTGIDFKIVAIRRHDFYSERLIDEILRRIKESLPFDPKTGHDLDTKRSFLGTPDQWDKFLAWEAHRGNAYRAAAEFLPKTAYDAMKMKRRPGDPSRSERQRDIAASIRHAVIAIQKWFPMIYPVRNLEPSSLRKPKA
jgi:hypothetical protein